LTMAWLDDHTRDEEGIWAAIAMATIPTKTTIEQSALDKTALDRTAIDGDARMAGTRLPAWPPGPNSSAARQDDSRKGPSGLDALQALLAFSALHQQVRNRRALAARLHGFETIAATAEFDVPEQFVLDEVLQMVAERAIAITGADGLGIALAENNEIVLRASAGTIKPDVGARIQRDSAFSGACFRMAQVIRCDDTETDDRVNLYACRQLGARSMVAVPLCGRRRVIGLLEAFSAEPFGFNDSDVVSLELLAELILGALKPEDEERFAESAQVAVAGLIAPADRALTQTTERPSVENVSAAPPAPEIKHEVNVASVNGTVAITAPASPDKLEADKREPDAEDVDLKKLDLKKQERETLDTGPNPAALNDTAANPTAADPAPIAHHPGVAEVLVLVVIFALVAGGFWWKLKNAQMGKALVQPPKVITKSEASGKQSSSSLSPTSIEPYSTSPSTTNVDAGSKPGSLNSGTNSKEVNAPATTGNATPQELSKMPRVTGIRHWSSADSSTVVLDLEDQVQYEAHRLSGPDRIYFDLHDTSLAPELEGQTIEIGDALLARVRVAQPVSGLTRLVLETKGNSNYSVSLEPNPYRLVVQVRKPGADPKAQVNLFPGAEGDRGKLFAIVVPPPTREDLQLRARVPKMRIVVDAGHGGWDLGTVGRRGLLEKDLVLEIAQRLAKLLETRLGANVILTRNDDNYIPLDERAGMANQAQADLFISVHANYSDLPSARGVETYYTNFFSSPNAKDLESRNPETRDQTHGAATAAVLSPAELHDKIEQSRRLAASVQRSLYGTLSVQNPGLRDRGVKEASYVVLTETAMPGILAEVSFVSSPADEQKLRSDGYREQIAEALYKGIARYAANSRGVKMASAVK
jgi:N-acetylmuramoyl-L-alanine amidase/putative methionine-R-sulfoxide reductase with GAF domain